MPSMSLLTDAEKSEIEKLLQIFTKTKNKEFEISFLRVSEAEFPRITGYFINAADPEDITETISLDISVKLNEKNTIRFTLLTEQAIKSFRAKFTESGTKNDIVKYLLSLKPTDVEIIYKNRGTADRYAIEDLRSLFKLTDEIPYDKKNETKNETNINGTEKFVYRLKNRGSVLLDNKMRLDMTQSVTAFELKALSKVSPRLELELEAISQKLTIDELINYYSKVIAVIQDSDIPLRAEETMKVLNSYKEMLPRSPSHHLDSRNPISMEVQHLVKFIPNRYCVTDKADGDRYFLLVDDTGTVYFLDYHLNVKKPILNKVPKPYFNTILDGELIRLEDQDLKLFMAFDVVYAKGIDYRKNSETTIVDRINVMNEVIDKAFGNLIPFENYTDRHTNIDQQSMRTFYEKALDSYWKTFKKTIDKLNGNSKNKSAKTFVTRKLYFIPVGISPSEVFMYADMIWTLLVFDNLAPYNLDGIIYTPINSSYMIEISGSDTYDSIPLEYKWKSSKHNSIDFYIKFQTDNTGKEAIYEDNSTIEGRGRRYKIATLYVGNISGSTERPVPFRANNIEQKSYIYIDPEIGSTVDAYGNTVSNSTVVEFIFDNESLDTDTGAWGDNGYKWIPQRTRYDKTESVNRHGKRYGNPLHIANRIWRSIVHPISTEDIKSLGNPETYEQAYARMAAGRVESTKNTTFYQKVSTDAPGMRAFNNFIKSNMIISYCQKGSRVLDIGCGRGGDIKKFIAAGVSEYVGLDIDANGLFVINDSALRRYQKEKKSKRNVPPMIFIQADARALFTPEAQKTALTNSRPENSPLIGKYLSGKKPFDVVNCQFSIHYYLSDKVAWRNFCTNLTTQLLPGGYFLVTCFDGELIYSQLKSKKNLSVTYTSNNGKKDTFFDIVKVYDDANVKPSEGLGIPIDVYNSLYSSQGTYNREFLVFPSFLVDEMDSKCDMELVETDSFFNVFNLYRNLFTTESKSDSGIPMSSIALAKYNVIRDYYESLGGSNSLVDQDAAMASFKLLALNRYFVFRRRTNNLAEPRRIVGMNQKIEIDSTILGPYFNKNHLFVDATVTSSDPEKIRRSLVKKYKLDPNVYVLESGHGPSDTKAFDEKIRLTKIHEGKNSNKIAILYKDNDEYHPVYIKKYQDFSPDDMTSLMKGGLTNFQTDSIKSYLLDSDSILDDLDFLIGMHEIASSD
jgi:SAM-dependent methyltransferase